MKELSVVVADDAPGIRDLLMCAFSKIGGFSVVGMAADGREACTMIPALQPQIVVLDISMPHKNGIEVLREIRQDNPQMTIIMFTADPSMILKRICFEAGADYYLDKTQLRELLDICREQIATRNGEQFLVEQADWKTRLRNYS